MPRWILRGPTEDRRMSGKFGKNVERSSPDRRATRQCSQDRGEGPSRQRAVDPAFPGQSLAGAGAEAGVTFAAGIDGLQLIVATTRIRNIRLDASPDKRAIFNDTSVASLGQIELSARYHHGLCPDPRYRHAARGHLEVNGLDIVAADTRSEPDRPRDFNVDVLQGAFTLWNRQTDQNLSDQRQSYRFFGRPRGAPVRGSGIFVSGAGDAGRPSQWCGHWKTEAVYSDGRIAARPTGPNNRWRLHEPTVRTSKSCAIAAPSSRTAPTTWCSTTGASSIAGLPRGSSPPTARAASAS